MTTATEHRAIAARRFHNDVADHQMRILHDDGVYRHIEFRHPDHGFHRVELVTWPGHLHVGGDMDGYTFRRLEDMFEFFRGSGADDINPQYWAEKVICGRDRVRVYDQGRFEELVKEHTVEAIRERCAPRGLGRAVCEEILDAPDIYYEDGARSVLEYFEYEGFRFHDTETWDLRDWDFWFLWACHAIRWGIARYDAARQTVQGSAA